VYTGGCRRPHRPPLCPSAETSSALFQGAPPTHTRTMFTIVYAAPTTPDVAPGNPSAVFSLATTSTPLAHPLPAQHDRAGSGSRF
jgi:hypothetical protein